MDSAESKLKDSLNLIAKSSLVVFLGVFLSKVLVYVYRIFIARHFGADVYGILSLSVVLLGFFIAIASLGLTEGMVRYISIYRGRKEQEKIQYLVRACYIFLLVSSIVAGAILFFSSGFISLTIFHEPRLVIFLKIMSFVIPFTIMSGPYLSILRGYEMISSYSFIYNIFQNAVKLIFIFLLVFFGISTISIPISYLIGIIAMFIASLVFAHKSHPVDFKSVKLEPSKKKSIRRSVFSYSWPLLFFGVISILFSWIDTFMIGHYKTVTEVGIYNAAVPLSLLLLIVPELFMQLFFPLITKYYAQKSHVLARDVTKQVGKWILILTIPLSILLIIYSEYFVKIFFGADYTLASQPLRILTIGMSVWAISLISFNLVSIAGRSKKLLSNFVLASGLNILLNALLIPSRGIVGAAIATSISYIFLSILFVFQSYKINKIIPFKKESFRVIISGLVSTVLLLITRSIFGEVSLIYFVSISLIFGIIYLFLLLVSGALDKEDTSILIKVLGRIRIFNPAH